MVESIVMKYLINMTKKDLLEAIEDMPMDAEVVLSCVDFWGDSNCVPNIEYNQYSNTIYITPGDDIEGD